jgi:DNA polymerase III subunit delta
MVPFLSPRFAFIILLMPPKIPPTVYLLHGEDDQAIEEFLTQLHAKLGDPSTAEMNTTRLDPKGLTLSTLRATCLTAPFLAKRRLVILIGFLDSLSSRRGKAPSEESPESEGPSVSSPSESKSLLQDFLRFLPEIPPSTALVLVERQTLPATHSIMKWSKDNADRIYIREFAPPKGSAVPAWIIHRAKIEGGEITTPAAQYLASVVGDDQRLLAQEIVKLLTYAGFSRAVTPDDVAALTPESVQADIFAMVDAIGNRDHQRALRLLRKTVEQGNAPSVFGMVVRQFRLLLLAREALDSGTPAAHLAQALEVHPFVAQKLAAQAKNFRLSSLEAVFRGLRDMDEDVKTGRTELDAAMESLVAKLTV